MHMYSRMCSSVTAYGMVSNAAGVRTLLKKAAAFATQLTSAYWVECSSVLSATRPPAVTAPKGDHADTGSSSMAAIKTRSMSGVYYSYG